MLAEKFVPNTPAECPVAARELVDLNGTRVTLRPATPGDVGLIEKMHERLSNESIYYRYLGPYKPASSDLQQLCSMSGEQGFVLLATVEEPQLKVVGIAYYCIDPQNPISAEPAVLVEDAYQGCGLGKRIIIRLCQKAVQNGVESFDTYVHPTNLRVLQMIRGSGLKHECRFRDGLKELRVWLGSTQRI